MWLASPLAALELPSGQAIAFQEYLVEPQDAQDQLARFRYVMAALEGMVYAEVEADFLTLCEAHALPLLRDHGVVAGQIIVSIGARVSEFGVTDPDNRQFFEVFRPEGDSCIWEGF